MTLDLINLKVENWDLMVKFYRDILGLKPIVLEHDHKYGWLDAGNIRVSIYEKKGLPSANDMARVSMQFQVQDIKKEIERLEALGCEFFNKQLDTGEAYRLASFRDPEGNPVSIYQLLS